MNNDCHIVKEKRKPDLPEGRVELVDDDGELVKASEGDDGVIAGVRTGASQAAHCHST